MAKKKGMISKNIGKPSADIIVVEGKNSYRLLRANSSKAVRVVEDRGSALKYAKDLQAKSRSSIFMMNEKGILKAHYAYGDAHKIEIGVVPPKKNKK